jgi:hypothetical protein
MTIRQSVISHLELLSRPSQQLEYEAKVPIANIHCELVSGFCSDLYHPKSQPFLDAFTEDELKDLARLYGLLMETGQLRVSSVSELLKQPQWRRVVAFAKDLVTELGVRG